MRTTTRPLAHRGPHPTLQRGSAGPALSRRISHDGPTVASARRRNRHRSGHRPRERRAVSRSRSATAGTTIGPQRSAVAMGSRAMRLSVSSVGSVSMMSPGPTRLTQQRGPRRCRCRLQLGRNRRQCRHRLREYSGKNIDCLVQYYALHPIEN